MSIQSNGQTPELFGNMARAEERAVFEENLQAADALINEPGTSGNALALAKARLSRAHALLGLEQKLTLWQEIRPEFDVFVHHECWEQAADCCDILYRSEHPDALPALVQGVWLSVSFPVDPELTLALLDQLIDALPPHTDGPALTAATAHYIVGLRASEDAFENLNFLTTNLLSRVARTQNGVETQEMLDFWIESHELNQPEVFLPRLGKILTAVLPEQDWWIDREAIRAKFPQ